MSSSSSAATLETRPLAVPPVTESQQASISTEATPEESSSPGSQNGSGKNDTVPNQPGSNEGNKVVPEPQASPHANRTAQATGTASVNGAAMGTQTATAIASASTPVIDPSFATIAAEGPKTGAIVGSLIGVIAVLGLVAGFLLYRRKYMKKSGPKTDSEREALEVSTQFLPSPAIVQPVVRSVLYLSDSDFSMSESVALQMAQHIKQHAQVITETHVKVTDTDDALSALKADVGKVVFVTQKAGRVQETKTGEILRVLEQHCPGKLQVVFYDFSGSKNQIILNVSTFTLAVQGDGSLDESASNDAALSSLIAKLGQV